MKTVKARITLTEQMLGSCCADPDVHRDFIASKSADAEKIKEELAALPAEEAFEKARTVFARGADGAPILFNYQFRGFLKSRIGVVAEFDEGPEIKLNKTKLSKFTFKRVVDELVRVRPRQIRLCDAVGPDCVRPLRATTMRGDRVALASSETVPAGTVFDVEITVYHDALLPLVYRALDDGADFGLCSWRGGGKGTFTWEDITPA